MNDAHSIIARNVAQPAAERSYAARGYATYCIDDIFDDAFEHVREKSMHSSDGPYDERRFRNELEQYVRVLVGNLNDDLARSKQPKISMPKKLPVRTISHCLELFHDLVVVTSDDGMRILAFRSPTEGVYSVDDHAIVKLIHEYTAEDSVVKSVKKYLAYSCSSVRELTVNPSFTPLEDGVFDYETGKIAPYGDDHVFLNCLPVSFPKGYASSDPVEPELGDGWKLTGWLHEIFEDDQLYELAWDLIGAILRPYRSWDRIIFFKGGGGNGKSTFLKFLRALVGRANTSELALDDFTTPERMFSLVGKLLNLGEENDAVYHQSVRRMKQIATGGVLMVRQLYCDQTFYTPHLMNIQLINEAPRLNDHSDAIRRRLLIFPFDKQFLFGAADKRIEDYVQDPAVVSWAAWYALVGRKAQRGAYYTLDNVAATDKALFEFEVEGDLVVQFVEDEFLPNFTGCFAPYSYLHQWFSRWVSETNSSSKSKVLGIKPFTERVKGVMTRHDDWIMTDRLSVAQWMVVADPYAEKYVKRYGDHVDQNDALGRFYDDGCGDALKALRRITPQPQRGFMREDVHRWCEAHSTKPYTFITDHGGSGHNGSHMNYTWALGRFVEGVSDGTLTDTVDFLTEYKAARGW